MIFEKAARLKLRFETSKGLITAEDLWDLPLTSVKGPSLNSVGTDLTNKVDAARTGSFVGEEQSSVARDIDVLKLSIVRHVVDTIQAENRDAKSEKERKDKKAHLLTLLADKENEEFKSMSKEEIRAALASL